MWLAAFLNKKSNARKVKFAHFHGAPLNRMTAIRFWREQKTPALCDSYGRNSTERTVNPNTTIPQTSPTWWSCSPLLRRGIHGSAQSNAYNLFGTGWAKALGLSFIWNDKIMMVLIYFYYYLCYFTNHPLVVDNGGQNSIHCWRWAPKQYE